MNPFASTGPVFLHALLATLLLLSLACSGAADKDLDKTEAEFVAGLEKSHQSWKFLGSGENGTEYYFVDKNLISATEDGHVFVWIKKIFITIEERDALLADEKATPKLKEMPHYLFRIEADCSEQRYRIGEVRRYDVAEEDYDNEDGRTHWMSPIPNTIGQAWYLAACRSEQQQWKDVRDWLKAWFE